MIVLPPTKEAALVKARSTASSTAHSVDERSRFRSETLLPVRDYDLTATLDSGQAFRWQKRGDVWQGVLGKHFVRLKQVESGIHAQTVEAVEGWHWLEEFLQSKTDLSTILATFPLDSPMTTAVTNCHGLRLLRQEPWECLASFILSSTKQIVQIRQIIALLCEKYGEPVKVATGEAPAFSFPKPDKIAAASETELRSCKMGFRAPGLLAAARQIAGGHFDLESLGKLPYADARGRLTTLHGVGGKIADCVLLFAYGFDTAFPLDVWVKRALQQLYFLRRRASEKRLNRFAATHFGPHAGYAQQYLFHYIRTKLSR
jgi:N-glycosylase/DNA lyase